MNFKNMPELTWPWGYPVVICVGIAVAVTMLLFFRKKKWL
jgi:magnesium transporter